jgi:hypothetical protein
MHYLVFDNLINVIIQEQQVKTKTVEIICYEMIEEQACLELNNNRLKATIPNVVGIKTQSFEIR